MVILVLFSSVCFPGEQKTLSWKMSLYRSALVLGYYPDSNSIVFTYQREQTIGFPSCCTEYLNISFLIGISIKRVEDIGQQPPSVSTIVVDLDAIKLMCFPMMKAYSFIYLCYKSLLLLF